MNEYFALDKNTLVATYKAASIFLLKNIIAYDKRDESEFIFVGDINMKNISRIVYVDGDCIYNNKVFWTETAPSILEDFDTHTVLDFLGEPVDQVRFETEMHSNASRISMIDQTAGEVDYNITVGSEFIALFREECIYTKFVGISPLEVGDKLTGVMGYIQSGSFREAAYKMNQIERDAFLTDERISRYIAMLNVANAVTYITNDADYKFTTAPEEEEVETVDEYVRIYGSYTSEKKRNGKYFLPKLAEGDKLIYLIRHSERGSDTSETGELTDNGVNMAYTFGTKLQNGKQYTDVPAIACEPNDAHYFSTSFTRTKHTAQAIAEGRGDTDYASTDYANITPVDSLVAGNRFWDGAHTADFKAYAYAPETLTAEQLTSLGVSTAEEAIEKRQADFNYITQELMKLADKRLNVVITHDYFLYAYVGAAVYTDESCTNPSTVCSSMDYLEGAAIIMHEQFHTFEVYPIKCNNT